MLSRYLGGSLKYNSTVSSVMHLTNEAKCKLSCCTFSIQGQAGWEANENGALRKSVLVRNLSQPLSRNPPWGA